MLGSSPLPLGGRQLEKRLRNGLLATEPSVTAYKAMEVDVGLLVLCEESFKSPLQHLRRNPGPPWRSSQHGDPELPSRPDREPEPCSQADAAFPPGLTYGRGCP